MTSYSHTLVKFTLQRNALALFARIPRADPSRVETMTAPGASAAEVLRLVRRLESLGLVEVTRKRPKAVRVAPSLFARALHGILSTRPYFAPLLQGSRLVVLGVLAAAEHPLSIEDLARLTGLHANTVRAAVHEFLGRSLLARDGEGRVRLAPHAPELRTLGTLFRDHVHERMLARHPAASPVLRKGSKLVVESEEPIAGLTPTAFYRFQLEGADVLAPRYQYVLSFNPAGESLAEAFENALALNAPPRTAQAMKALLGNA